MGTIYKSARERVLASSAEELAKNNTSQHSWRVAMVPPDRSRAACAPFRRDVRDGRALCVVDDDAQRRVSLRDVSNRCAQKGGRAEVDAERVDENDSPKTTRKTTTPLVRERRDEECKHRGEGGEGRNGCIKND